MDIGNAVGAPFNGYVLRGGSGGVIFVRVNQVLVRLWARRGRKSDRMWSVLRDGSSRDRGRCVQRRVLCMPPVGHCPRLDWGGLGPVVLSKMILARDRLWDWRLVIWSRLFSKATDTDC